MSETDYLIIVPLSVVFLWFLFIGVKAILISLDEAVKRHEEDDTKGV